MCCDIYAHYACVADCADAMADAWEDTGGCAHADCLHGNILRYSKVIVHRYVGIAQDCAHRIIDCAQRSQVCAYSHTAALCNYSFLVSYARSSKSPILYVVEVDL